MSYSALGQTPRDTAHRLYDEGTAAFQSGDWSLAIKKYKDAYSTIPNPTVLIALADAYRSAGNFAAMRDMAQKYLAEAPSGEYADKARRLSVLSPPARKADEVAASSPHSGPPTWAWALGGAAVLGVGAMLWVRRKR